MKLYGKNTNPDVFRTQLQTHRIEHQNNFEFEKNKQKNSISNDWIRANEREIA